MCPGETHRPPVNQLNRIEGATNEPPLPQQFPGEPQAPPVDHHNNDNCPTEDSWEPMSIPNSPGETQATPVDHNITNGEAYMHPSSTNSSGANQTPPVDLQHPQNSDDDIVPTQNLPITWTPTINNPIPTTTQSPKWQRTNKHKLPNNRMEQCGQQIIWHCILPNFSAVSKAYHNEANFSSYIAAQQIDATVDT